jgi:hypothetical protein
MGHCRAGSGFGVAQDQRERHRRDRDQHQRPEHVDIGQERGLDLHLLPDPGEGLLLSVGCRAAMGYEVVRRPLQRLLVLDA